MALGIDSVHEAFTRREVQQCDQADSRRPEPARPRGAPITSLSSQTVRSRFSTSGNPRTGFHAFGSTLIPILTELGISLKDPMVATVHNVIAG